MILICVQKNKERSDIMFDSHMHTRNSRQGDGSIVLTNK